MRALPISLALLSVGIAGGIAPAHAELPAYGLAAPSATGVADAAPFAAQAEPLALAAGQSGAITLKIQVPPGTTLYQDMIRITVLDAAGLQLGEPSLPPAMRKLDPVMKVERDVYELDVYVEIPVTAPAGAGSHEVLVEASWQGCKGSVCYMPQTEQLAAAVEISEPESSLRAAPAVDPLGWLVPAASAEPLTDDNPIAVGVRSEGGLVLVDFKQKDGWHLTQMMTFIEVAEGQPVTAGEQLWPEAHQRPDPAIPGTTRGEFDGNFTAYAQLAGPAGDHAVKGTVGYQACQAEKCLLPQYYDFDVQATLGDAPAALPEASEVYASAGGDHGDDGAAQAEEAPAEGGEDAAADPLAEQRASSPPGASASGGGFEAAAERGLGWLLLFVFGAGVLVSLTPCVLPMVPITVGIIGARSDEGKLKGFLLSLTYVAGLALVYTLLGVAAALTGSLFGGWMQSPWVVGAVALFFAAMGASMFGAFDVAVPDSLTNRFQGKGGAGFGGAFVVGMIGGVVAGPCSGPVIATLMVMIGQNGQIGLGAALMGVFSLGIGMIFLLSGTFSGFLFRPGPWMDTIKKSFGILLWLGAIYYVAPHLSTAVVALLTAFVLLSTGVFAWPDPEMDEGITLGSKRLYSIVGVIVGAYLLLGTMISEGFILPPLSLNAGPAESHGAEQHVIWGDDEPEALAMALAEGKPVIVDFTADWCAACKELEAFTYTDPAVVSLSGDFVTVMIDATRGDDEVANALLEKYNVLGLPTVKFLTPDGTPMDDLTLTGFEPAEDFLPRMETALARLD